MQAKFGQYLQNAKDPRLISQTEKAVEWEQVSSKEQVLPMPDLRNYNFLCNNEIDYSESLDILGVSLKYNLSWDLQVVKISRRVNLILHNLYRFNLLYM